MIRGGGDFFFNDQIAKIIPVLDFRYFSYNKTMKSQ